MKLFIQTILGIGALIAGVSLLYFFMTGLSTGVNFILLILSIIFIGAGGFLFIRVSKIENAIPEAGSEVASKETGSKLLEKNNQMIQDWGKVNTKKDNLKAIQIAANAQEQATKEQMAS